MTVRLYDVVQRQRDPASAEVTDVWADFVLRKSEAAAPEDILASPLVSLYSLDLANDSVIFVEGPDARELAAAPFSYMAQRRLAKRVLKIDVQSFLDMHEPADEPMRVLHLYSVGRCGSTLLHNALNRVDGVASLSEPDVLFQVALWIKSGRVDPDLATRVARATLCSLWRKRPAGCEILAIKHRGKNIWAHREFRDACPEARSFFLYRNAIDTIQSFDRISGYVHGRTQWRFGVPIVSTVAGLFLRAAARRSGIELYGEHLRQGSPLEVVARCGYAGHHLLDWISKVDSYIRLRALEPACASMRYLDLVAAPEPAMRALISAYDLPPCDMSSVLSVFGTDAQTGTPLARAPSKHPLDARTKRAIRRVLREQKAPEGDEYLPGALATSPSSHRGIA